MVPTPSAGADEAANDDAAWLDATIAAADADGVALGDGKAVHGFRTPTTTNARMATMTAIAERSRRSLTGCESGTGSSSVGTLTEAPAQGSRQHSDDRPVGPSPCRRLCHQAEGWPTIPTRSMTTRH